MDVFRVFIESLKKVGVPTIKWKGHKRGDKVRMLTAVSSLALHCLWIENAAASSVVHNYDVSASSLKDALRAIAEQSDHSVLFPFNDVRTLSTEGIEGEYSLEEALSVLLKGTGLQAQITEGSVVTIVKAENSQLIENEETMNSKISKTSLLGRVSAIVTAIAAPGFAQAQEAAGASADDEIVVLGSRNVKPRSASDSPVPVDVIGAEQLNSLGGTADITDNLKAFVPSYTATPATGDGSAFVRPTSLRGLAPDQTLVLVNGKRRHRSALLHFFAPAAGNGAHGPDIGMIPAIALKNVQVLRDGAASQYGSDAIAGVMNFELKDAAEGGSLDLQVGRHYEGEVSARAAGNIGFSIFDGGFLNVSAEYWDNPQLSRGVQRPVGQDLIDAGVAGVGADDPTGNGLVQTWGRTATEGFRSVFNAAVPVGENSELYAFGNYADTHGQYRFFYRAPDHGSIADLMANNPVVFAENPLPAGFTPLFNGDQIDVSAVAGINGETDGGIFYDFSFGYGKNELRYSFENGLNGDAPLLAGDVIQRNFDLGGYDQEELNINADFSMPLSDNINLAFGAEWREESYTLIAGEEAATVGSGTTGYRPPTADLEGTFTRENIALYADVEYDVTDQLLLQGALRYEDFSDFGDTVNGKIAARYNVNDMFGIRGAFSTGFHAPTPGQSNITTQITTFDGMSGLLTIEGLVPPGSPEAVAAGGAPLTEEKSKNYSVGVTADLGLVNLTVDAYQIDIEDRIYRTGDIPLGTGSTVSFFTNALDMTSKGIDVVASSDFEWNANASTSLVLAANYNEIEITGQDEVGGITPVSDSIIEDIENNYPNFRFALTTNTQLGEKVNVMVRGNYYGSHYDERGTIGDTSGNASWDISPELLIDVELGYNLSDATRIILGAANILDNYPDVIPDDGVHANRQSVGLPYPRRTPVNYEGGSVYLRLNHNF